MLELEVIWGLKRSSHRSISAFLLVFLEHTSETNDDKVFKLGVGNDLGYPGSDIQVLGFKVTD